MVIFSFAAFAWLANRAIEPMIKIATRYRIVASLNWTLVPSLRANGSRECAPDDRLREAIQVARATGKTGLLRRFRLPPSLCELRRTRSLVEATADESLLRKDEHNRLTTRWTGCGKPM